MTTYVMVHGAWAGAWSLMRTVDRLWERGHRVFAPTLSGLGERSHLAKLVRIDLTTHIDDVVNEVLWNDLDDFVLVGHSYGGIVITGAAERIGERIRSIVFLDALVPGDGQSFEDFFGKVKGEMVPPPPTSPGDYPSEEDRLWVDSKATPHPAASMRQKLDVTGAYERIASKHYVVATGWNGFASTADRFRVKPGWQVHGIDTGHDIAVEKPEELADLLENCA